mmetsp:Transcript_40469/g.29137  ORF Transcript_40469/g.29137 Transcript_40469/m.29137 type:complete len:82 (+) Transcript_40469:25-270(+)
MIKGRIAKASSAVAMLFAAVASAEQLAMYQVEQQQSVNDLPVQTSDDDIKLVVEVCRHGARSSKHTYDLVNEGSWNFEEAY